MGIINSKLCVCQKEWEVKDYFLSWHLLSDYSNKWYLFIVLHDFYLLEFVLFSYSATLIEWLDEKFIPPSALRFYYIKHIFTVCFVPFFFHSSPKLQLTRTPVPPFLVKRGQSEEKKIPKGVPLQFNINSVGKQVNAFLLLNCGNSFKTFHLDSLVTGRGN